MVITVGLCVHYLLWKAPSDAIKRHIIQHSVKVIACAAGAPLGSGFTACCRIIMKWCSCHPSPWRSSRWIFNTHRNAPHTTHVHAHLAPRRGGTETQLHMLLLPRETSLGFFQNIGHLRRTRWHIHDALGCKCREAL